MPINDNVNGQYSALYVDNFTVAGNFVGSSFDTIGFGSILSVGMFLFTHAYVADHIIGFEDSDDESLWFPIPVDQIINPQNSFVITEVSTLEEPVPSWGFLGIRRYLRISTTGGVGNTFSVWINVTPTQKPVIDAQ